MPHRNRSQSSRIIYQNKGNLSLYSNLVVKRRSEHAHKSTGPFFCVNRDRSPKSSVNIAKFEFRKLDFAPLNFIAMIFETIFSHSLNVPFFEFIGKNGPYPHVSELESKMFKILRIFA